MKSQKNPSDIVNKFLADCAIAQEASKNNEKMLSGARARMHAILSEGSSEGAAKSDSIPLLITQLQHENADICLRALNAIVNLLKDNAVNQAPIAELGGAPILLQLLRNPNSDISLRARESLSNLPQAAPGLIVLLCDGNTDIQIESLVALANLTYGKQANQEISIKAGAVPTLVRLLGSQDDGVRSSAVKALHSLFFNPDASPESIADNQRRALHAGAIPLIIGLINHEDFWVQADAVLLLTYLAQNNESNQLELIQAGVIPALLQSLEEKTPSEWKQTVGDLFASLPQAIPEVVSLLSNDLSDQKKALTLIESMCCKNHLNQSLIGETQAIPTLINLMLDENECLHSGAANVLAHLAKDNPFNQKVMRDAGLIPLLFDLFKKTRATDSLIRDGRSSAVYALGCLAQNNLSNQIAIREADGITLLLESLKDTNAYLCQLAAFSLGCLAQDNTTNQAIIIEGGAIPPLLLLAHSDSFNTNAHLYASEALFYLSESETGKAAIMDELEGSLSLLKMLDNKGKSVRLKALEILVNLISNPESQETIAEWGAIPLLLEQRENKDKEVSLKASEALDKLAHKNPDNKSAITRSASISRLLESLKSDNMNVLLSAVRDLGIYARKYANRETIVKAGGIPTLLQLIENESAIVRARTAGVLGWFPDTISHLVASLSEKKVSLRSGAIQALERLSLCEKNQQAIIEAKAIPWLIHSLKDRNTSSGASAVIANLLGKVDSAQKLVAEAGGIPLLILLLEDENDITRFSATKALKNLTRDESLREAVIKAGALLPLLSLLKAGNEAICLTAAVVLEHLAHDNPNNQATIAQTDAIALLVQLLKNDSKRIRASAIRAIESLIHKNEINQKLVVSAGGTSLLVTLLSDWETKYSSERVLKSLPQAIPELVSLLPQANEELRKTVILVLASLAEENPTNQASIFEVGGIPALVTSLNSKDEWLGAYTARALKNLAQKNQVNQNAMVDAGAIPALMALLDAKDAVIRDDALAALDAIIDENKDNQEALCKAGFIQWLVTFLERHTNSTLALSTPLDMFAKLSNFRGYLGSGHACSAVKKPVAKIATFLVKLLEQKDDSLLPNVLKVFENVSGNKCYNDAIFDAKGIPLFVQFLTDGNEGIRSMGAGILAKLPMTGDYYFPYNSRIQRAIADAGAIPLLVQLLKDKNPRVRDKASKALASIAAKNQSNQEAIAGTEAIKLLTSMVKAKADGGEDLLYFGPLEALVVFPQAIPELVRILMNRESLTTSLLLKSLRNFAKGSTTNQRSILNANAVPMLAQLLEGDDKYVSAHALQVLRELSNEPSARETIIEVGVVPLVVNRLRLNPPEVDYAFFEEGVKTLKNLAHNNQSAQEAIAQTGILSLFFSYLEDKNDEKQTLGRELLEEFPRAITAFVKQLSNKETRLSLPAMQALRHLADGDLANQEAIAKAGAVPLLVKLMKHDEERVCSDATDTLEALARNNSDNQALIAETGIVPELLNLFVKESASERSFGKLESAELLLARLPQSIPALLEMIPNSNPHLEEDILRVFVKLLSDSNNQKLIIELGAVPTLVLLGCDTNDYLTELVVRLGEPGIQELVSLLESQNPHMRRRASNSLSIILESDFYEEWDEFSFDRFPVTDELLAASHLIARELLPKVTHILMQSLLDENLDAVMAESGAPEGIRLYSLRMLFSLLNQDLVHPTDLVTNPDFIPTLVKLPYTNWLYQLDAVTKLLRILVRKDSTNQTTIVRSGGIQMLLCLFKNDFNRAASELSGDLAENNVANQVAIAEAGIIPLLVKQLGNKDRWYRNDEGILSASTALNHLAHNNPNNQVAIIDAGAIPLLVWLLENQNTSMAAMTLLEKLLFKRPESILAVAKSLNIPLLVKSLASDTPDVRVNAASNLKGLACVPANQTAIIEAGGVSALMQLLLVGDERVFSHAVNTLGILSKAITELGQLTHVISELLALLAHDTLSTRLKSLETLEKLTQQGEISDKIVTQHYDMSPLVTGLQCDNEPLCLGALRVLINLLERVTYESTLLGGTIAINSAPLLIGLLEHKNKILRLGASKALNSILSESTQLLECTLKKSTLIEEATPLLLALLDDDDKEVRIYASETLKDLSYNRVALEVIAKAGAVPKLVQLREERSIFTRCLKMYNQDFFLIEDSHEIQESIGQAIVETGGIQALRQLLEHKYINVRLQAVVVFDFLARCGLIAPMLSSGVTPALNRLLEDGNKFVRTKTFKVLAAMVFLQPNVATILVELGFVALLPGLLKDRLKWKGRHHEDKVWYFKTMRCCSVVHLEPLRDMFTILAYAPPTQVIPPNPTCIKRLLQFFTCNDEDIHYCVMVALGLLAQNNPQNQSVIVKAGGIQQLSQLLKESKKEYLRRSAALVLGTIACQNTSYQAAVMDSNCISSFIPLLLNDEGVEGVDNEKVRQKISSAFWNVIPNIQRHDAGFINANLGRLGGSSFCSGVFCRESDGSMWLGKCNAVDTEEGGAAEACLEIIANTIYGCFGVAVPRTTMARLPIILPEWAETLEDLGLDRNPTHAMYLLSEIIADFHTFPGIPDFKPEEKFYLSDPKHGLLEVIGLGHILAMARFLNDVDAIGGSGGNIGYQVVGQQAHCFNIDPGFSFATTSREIGDREIQVASNAPDGVICFDQLPHSVRQEFINTLRLIEQMPNEEFQGFFEVPGTECLLHSKKGRDLRKNGAKRLIDKKVKLLHVYEKELSCKTDGRDYLVTLKRTQPTKTDLHASIANTRNIATHRQDEIGGARKEKVLPIVKTIPFSDLQYDTKTNRLGSGSYSDVYQAKWKDTNVAVKVLKAQGIPKHAIQALCREAAMMIELHHPNIVEVKGVCLEPGHCSLVVALAARGSLHSVLSNPDERLEWPLRLKFALGIASGLSFLHKRCILHRDLKSLNVLLEGNTAMITDFGLAKIKSETRSALTQQGSEGAVGTLPWIAPELFKPRIKYRKACDIYSLAVTFWEIAARRTPWKDAAAPALISLWVAQGERETFPDDTPPVYRALIERCWDQQAENRPPIGEVVEILETTTQ